MDDPVRVDRLDSVDSRTLEPGSEILAKRGRFGRVREAGAHEMEAGRFRISGQEQAKALSRGADLEQDAVRCRLKDLLDPPPAQHGGDFPNDSVNLWL